MIRLVKDTKYPSKFWVYDGPISSDIEDNFIGTIRKYDRGGFQWLTHSYHNNSGVFSNDEWATSSRWYQSKEAAIRYLRERRQRYD